MKKEEKNLRPGVEFTEVQWKKDKNLVDLSWNSQRSNEKRNKNLRPGVELTEVQ